MEQEIILVDLMDNEVGSCEKLMAHEQALLHRAFSVFLYHDQQMLIQKRADHKYHCGGLWTNSCCSHPNRMETTKEAVTRRLWEEIQVKCQTEEIFSFSYYYHFNNGLTEYEYDHVYIGEYEGECQMDFDEISEMKWISFDELLKDAQMFPERYTPWFLIALPKVIKEIQRRNA